MSDVMSAEKRSALMSRIRAKDTRPELRLRKLLWQAGFRYRLHGKQLSGQPDLVFPKWNAVVFVHGCFWHAHIGCPYFQLPKTRPEFWARKLEQNRNRDSGVVASLRKDGWRVAVVWECALRAEAATTTQRLALWLRSTRPNIEIEGSNLAGRRRSAVATNGI